MITIGVAWLLILADASLKAALLALLVGAALKLLGIKDSCIRHRAWAGVLAGMALLPLLSPIMPALRLPLVPSPQGLVAWMLEPPPAALEPAPQPASLPREFAAPTAEPSRIAALPDDRDSSSVTTARQIDPQFAAHHFSVAPQSAPADIAGDVLPQNYTRISSPEPTTVPPAQAAPTLPSLRTIALASALALALIWLIGVVALLTRLSAGVYLAHRIRATSRPIDISSSPDQSRLPSVRESDRICVPLTIGIFRSTVLLPAEWRTWRAEKLRAVLAHEQMHVQRRDCLVNLLSEINFCLYWFHPLARWLRQRLAALAEHACDDAAIDTTGSRAQYARHLLEVAAAVSKQGRLVPTGVSMARRTQVEARIHAILDFSRPLSRRLSWSAGLALIALLVPLILLAAALKPSSGQQESARPTTNAAKEPEKTQPSKPESPAPSTAKALSAQPADPTTPAPTDEHITSETFTYAGTVVDDRGQPVRGAVVALAHSLNMPPGDDLQRLAITDDRGQFSFTRKLGDLVGSTYPEAWIGVEVTVAKPGYGFGMAPISYLETTGRLLKELNDRHRSIAEWHFGKPSSQIVLVPDDVPLRGRLVNSEGQPVAGAKVVVAQVCRGKQGTLDDWLTAATAPGADEASARRHIEHFSQGGLMIDSGEIDAPHALVAPPVTTDADGRFNIAGLGRERLVELYISGPGIASTTCLARTRTGDPIRLSKSATWLDLAPRVYHPAEFTLIVTPTVPVIGRVTDHRTGEPLAGWLVKGHKIATNEVNGGFEAAYIHTITDADGRYRLEGLPLGDNTIAVKPPKKSGYFGGIARVKLAPGDEPPVRDLVMHRGVMVRGRVTDSRTGKPVFGTLSYFSFENNPHLEAIREKNISLGREGVAQDGQFEIPVLPGPGLLTFMASPDEDFPRGAGADQIDGPKSVSNDTFFRTSPYLVSPGNFSLLSPINPPADVTELTHDLMLTSGRSLLCRVRRADGHPLARCYVYGQQAFAGWFYSHEASSDHFTVRGYFPKEGRRVMVYQPEGNLIAWQDLTGDVPDEFELVLKPAGKFIGRVVDEDGAPREGLSIGSGWGDFLVSHRYSPAVAKTWGELPSHLDNVATLTDKDGRFELPGVVPGLVYNANVSGPQKILGRMQQAHLGTVFENAAAASGQTKDLGDLKIKPTPPFKQKETTDQPPAAEKKKASSSRQAKSKAARSSKDRPGKFTSKTTASPRFITVFGAVKLPTGQPAAGATVRAAAPVPASLEPVLGKDYRTPLIEAKADAAGHFSIRFTTQPFGNITHLDAHWQQYWKKTVIAASLPGYGPSWISYDELSGNANATDQEVQLQLVDDLPVRGRVIDLEGQPIANLAVKIGEPRAAKDDDLTAWLAGLSAGEMPWTLYQKLPRAVEPRLIDLPAVATTDEKGTLEIRGIGRDRVFALTFSGENVAHRQVTVVTRAMEPRRRLVGLPKQEGAEPVFGVNFTYSADPARVVEGRVIDAKTRQPLAGVNIQSMKLAGYPYWNHHVLKATTDAAGRFRLVGMPKAAGNWIMLVPSDDQPYFMREVEVPDPVGLGPATLEAELHRGLWITGRVSDKQTGEGVPGVWLGYYALRSNPFARSVPAFHTDGRMEGEQSRYQTKADGTFKLVGLPGRAIVGAKSWLRSYVEGVGYDEIDAPKDGKTDWIDVYRNPISPSPKFPTSMKLIDPPASAAEFRVDLQLDPGRSLKIQVTDPAGNPLTGVSIAGLTPNGYYEDSDAAEVTAVNLGPKETRTILFHHKERNLGRGLQVTPVQAATGRLTVKLEPCGIVKGRAMRQDQTPLAGLAIESRVEPVEDFSRQLPRVAADQEGRFEATLLPGLTYTLAGMGGGFQYLQIAQELSAEPGQTKDLGTLLFDDEGRLQTASAAMPNPSKTKDSQASQTAAPTQPPPAAAKTNSAMQQGQEPQPRTIIGRSLNAAMDWLGKRSPPPRTIHGRVVDENRRPLAGVKVEVARLKPVPERWLAGGEPTWNTRGTTDENGRFSITLSSEEASKGWGPVIRHPNYSLAYLDVRGHAITGDLGDIVLERERLITGRLITPEGQPIAGAQVALQTVMEPKEGPTLDAFLRAWKQDANLALSSALEHRPAFGDFIAPITTDADGRYTLAGLPAERIAVVDFSGPDMATFTLLVVNCTGFDAAPYNDSIPTIRRRHERKLASPGGTHVCVPDFKLTGQITSDDGKPVAGVNVSAMIGYWPRYGVRTDAGGRYRLAGLPRGDDQLVSVAPHGGFLPRTIGVEARLDEAEKTLDIVLRRGLVLRGRVTDAVTGEGVRGGIRFVPLHNNDYVKQPGYDAFDRDRTMRPVAADGTFSLDVIPGPGVVLMQVFNQGPKIGDEQFSIYRTARFREEDRPFIKFYGEGERQFLAAGDSIEFLGEIQNAAKYVNFSPDTQPEPLDLRLDRGKTLDLELADADGKPLEGVFVSGITEQWPIAAQLTDSKFTVYALGADAPRRVALLHAERDLAGQVTLTGDEQSPLRVTLGAAASFHGRALDENGEPITGAEMNVYFQHHSASELYRFHHLQQAKMTTDAAGRFKMDDVLPDEEFFINLQIGEKFFRPKPNAKKKLAAGETRDLGDIVFAHSSD